MIDFFAEAMGYDGAGESSACLGAETGALS